MSIVPYNPNNEIVYHDPDLRIMVIHNNQDNTIQLLTSVADENRFTLNETSFLRPKRERERVEPRCPNCGIILTDFLNQNARSDFRRRSSTGKIPIPTRPETNFTSDMSGLVPAGFMHNDYFKLLANLPYESNCISNSESDSLPSELFNQGYFDRFFRKVPPEILGSGAHAQVYKVMHMLKNIQLGIYALKRINVGDHSQFLDQVLNEVVILYELTAEGANENNLIRYNHVWMELGDMKDLNTIFLNRDGHALSDPEKVPYVYILQQYCDGGHLENLIVENFQKEQFMTPKERLEKERQRRRSQKLHRQEPESRMWLSDFEIWKFFRDIANGVNYLHSKGILHRDLKPSNCLLETKYHFHAEPPIKFASIEELEQAAHMLPRVLVSDFGEGKFIDKQLLADACLQLDDERRGNTGTIEFTDPKLWVYAHFDGKLDERKFAYNFTKMSDIYSLGIILCYLCVGKLPFSNEITDRTDPERIRGDIARWHDLLSPESFGDWFQEKVQDVHGSFSECLKDFEYLIYLMIKSEGPEEVLTSGAIMEYLESMKWQRFVNDRKHSEATITEVPKTGDLESVFDEDGLNLDLTNTLAESSPRVSKPELFSARYMRYGQGRTLVVVSLYVASIAVLELLRPETDYELVLLAKFLNVAGLAGEVLLDGTSVQNYVSAVCVGMTYYAFHRCQ